MLRRGVPLLLGLISLLMVSDFVLRAIVPASAPDKTDFSELYTSAWLWRHGQNPYDSNLATSAQQRLVGASARIAPIYPPTALALVSPFTFLRWGRANLIWLLLALVGVGGTIFLLLRIRGSEPDGLKAMVFVTFLLSFSPLHQSFHLGNVALLVVPLSLWAILLAERDEDWWAGFLLGIAVGLKPQIGVWVLLYYLLRGRKRVFFGALTAGALIITTLLFRLNVLRNALSDYQANLHYWFDPGRPFGFTEGAFPFHVNIMQVVLYQMLRSVRASNLIAHTLFVGGLAVWLAVLWRSRFRVPASLAISSLLALSFVSLYHSVCDSTMLTLALCWAVPVGTQPWTRTRILTCGFLFFMMLPGHSLLMRLSPHVSASITAAWWWHLFVARYFVWLLLALNVALLAGLWESARRVRETDRLSTGKNDGALELKARS
jgi:hypothetical protein